MTLDLYLNEKDAKMENKPVKMPAVKEARPGILEEWLEKNFRKQATKRNYRRALSCFLSCVYGDSKYNCDNVDDGLFLYFHQQRNLTDDLKGMIRKSLSEEYSSTTINMYVNLTMRFFSKHDRKVPEDESDIIKNSLLPANVVATQDETLIKEQFRQVLSHLPIQHRALVLLLLSSGCRVGEALQVKIEDLKLDEDPPSINIRPEYTKKEVGGRTIWMSYEARDAIKEWLKVKDLKRKGGGFGDYRGPLVFPFSYRSAQGVWQQGLHQSGLKRRDAKTGVHIYHIHTLRKFFRTQMGLARVPDFIVHAWMGHKAYLAKAYDRPKKELAKLYKDHMGAVSIYLQTVEEETKQIIVRQRHVAAYLQRGWRFVTKLAEDQIIMEGKSGQIIPEEVKEPETEPEPKPSQERVERVKGEPETLIQMPSPLMLEPVLEEPQRKAPEGYIYCAYWKDTLIRPEDCDRCARLKAEPRCPKLK